MLAIGLTGGIGSGKSTVADLMVQRGALLIDADEIAREVVAPGGPAFEPLLERFGSEILDPQGRIERKVLAAIAFGDPEKLKALNAITHPAIGSLMVERRQAQEGSDRIVLLDIPLLKPVHRDLLSLDRVVVVDAPVEIAIERLVDQRGFDRGDAEARVAAQIDRFERLAGADYVIDNSVDRQNLLRQVDAVWDDLVGRERSKESQAGS